MGRQKENATNKNKRKGEGGTSQDVGCGQANGRQDMHMNVLSGERLKATAVLNLVWVNPQRRS